MTSHPVWNPRLKRESDPDQNYFIYLLIFAIINWIFNFILKSPFNSTSKPELVFCYYYRCNSTEMLF